MNEQQVARPEGEQGRIRVSVVPATYEVLAP